MTLVLLREKRVVLSPMLERRAVCGKQRPTEGCRPATREQKAVVTDFASAGRFLITFLRDEKVMIERLEENKCEQ